jgi:hypothetical protein
LEAEINLFERLKFGLEVFAISAPLWIVVLLLPKKPGKYKCEQG